MKKLVLVVSACALLATPAFARKEAKCKADWFKADVNKDGALTAAEGERYLAAMRVANKTLPSDGRLSEAMFLEHCKANVFKGVR